MIFVDTSAFLFLLDKGQTENLVQKAKQFALAANEPFCTSDLVIEETHKWLVHHGRPTSQSFRVLKSLIQEDLGQILEIEHEDRLNALADVEKYADQKLSYTDAITVAMMRRLGLHQVFSFDRHFLLFPGIERVPV